VKNRALIVRYPRITNTKMTWSILNIIRQRIGEEEGVLRKGASIRVALCHPSPYYVAMSSLGYQAIYGEIHAHADASAERAFLPDNPEDYRKNHLPVLSYETETPIADFPVVAFSIACELELTGILEMLDLSGIPLLRENRTEKHPLVIAGGPLTNSNPVVLAPFIDLLILGEGEDLVHVFLDAAAGNKKRELLEKLATIPGCYVPGTVSDLPPIAKVCDDHLPAFSRILTSGTVLSSMFLVEPERGCSRGCTYCVMRRTTNGGMRVVPLEKIFSLIPENAKRVGLVGAAVTDHPELKELVAGIVAGGRQIGISSLRADRLDEELVRLLAKGGYRTLTTASDGVSQRLRNLIDRKTTEHHLMRAAELVRNAGLHRLKLYEMVGLPGETMEDIDELIRFSIELSKIAPLSLSISLFAAKRNTPLDGAPFEPIPSISAKLARIRAGLKGRVDVRPASARWAWVEYMLSQSGEAAGLAAMDAWRAGGSFLSWKQAFANREVKTFRCRPFPDGRRNVQDPLSQL
jgi:radical SAM superfamily enzyme YgiQ (UPF0313 family)